MPTFSYKDYARLIDDTVENIRSLSTSKGGEYAGDQDRLANFRRNGVQLGLPMETIWAVYYNKHHDAVMQYIQDLNSGKDRVRLEPISGRIDDMLTYLILFKAMLVERSELKLSDDPLPSTSPSGNLFVDCPHDDDGNPIGPNRFRSPALCDYPLGADGNPVGQKQFILDAVKTYRDGVAADEAEHKQAPRVKPTLPDDYS